MKRSLTTLFKAAKAATQVESQTLEVNKDLELLRKKMQERLKNKLNNATYKQALAQQVKDNEKNDKALEETLNKTAETFKYFSVY